MKTKKPDSFALPPMSKEALNSLPFGAYIINTDGFVEFFNDKMVKISGVKEAKEVEGQNITQIPNYKKYGLLNYIEKGLKGEPFRIEGIKYVSFIGKKESCRSYYGIPIKDDKGGVIKLLCIVEDITEKKKNQEQIRSDLVEKEILLKEVQHRVKNNMQIVYSLLNLQSGNIQDKQARGIIDESKNQIKSMLLIHDSLYQEEDLAKINFNNYIENLILNLFDAYRVDRERIGKKIDVQGIELDIGRAIPCALIINEIITNSLKYAFPGNRRGEIKIIFKPDDEINYKLEISDNGIGFNKKELEQRGSLGTHLVNTLAKQIYGSIKINSKNGVLYIIKFPKVI